MIVNCMYNIVIKKNDRFYFMLLAMCMLLGMLSPNMSAQGMSNADITGKVVDQYGNPVSDVTVTMKNLSLIHISEPTRP